jgi:valyl-tRNA synthetase
MELIRAIRNIRAERNVEPGRAIPLLLSAGDERAFLEGQRATLVALAKLAPEALEIATRLPDPPEGSIPLVVGPLEAFLPLAGLMDPETEIARLQSELAEAEAQSMRLETLLAGEFSARAPAEIVEKERRRLAEFNERITKLNAQIESLR